MSSNSITKSVLLAGILTGAFLVSSASFAQAAATTPASTVKTTPSTSMPATASTASTVKVNETCKKEHPDLNGKAYKDCVKDADKVKMN